MIAVAVPLPHIPPENLSHARTRGHTSPSASFQKSHRTPPDLPTSPRPPSSQETRRSQYPSLSSVPPTLPAPGWPPVSDSSPPWPPPQTGPPALGSGSAPQHLAR